MTHLADEQLLEQFRQWLEKTRAEADELAANGSAARRCEAESPAVGLYRLAEEFTALRHEVKLQTRTAFGREEETDKLLNVLGQSLDVLRSIEPPQAQAATSAGKRLALALAELDEALDRGRQQLEKSRVRLLDESEESLLADLDNAYAGQSWLRRLLARGYHQQVRSLLERSPDQARRQALFAALVDGYALIQQRLSRTLAAEGIVRIATVGQTVEPEQMIVLEVVEAEGPSRRVVDEVRRGYTWNGRLLRCAEVRATRMDLV